MIIIGIIAAVVTAIVLVNGKGGDKADNSADADTSLADGSRSDSTECKNEYYFSYNDYYDKVANPATGNSDPHCFGQKFVDAVSATGSTLKIGDYTLTFPSDWSVSKADKLEQIRVAGGGNPCAPTAAYRIGILERFGDLTTSSTRGLSVAMSTNMSAVSLDNDDSWDPMLYDFDAKENVNLPNTKSVTILPCNQREDGYNKGSDVCSHYAFFIELESNIVVELDTTDNMYNTSEARDKYCQEVSSGSSFGGSTDLCVKKVYSIPEIKELISNIKVAKS